MRVVVVQRLQIPNNDSTKLRVGRIDQAVILVWGENGRHEKHAALTGGYKLIAKSCEFRRGSGIPPVRRQLADDSTLSLVTSSGTSATAKTRSVGGSSLSRWTKYSSMAND